MTTYIALLRGINVSGQKKIKMVELKSHLGELHFRNISTYVQSGNVLFEYEKTDTADLARQVQEKIKEKYGFEVVVFIKTLEDLEVVLENNPFRDEDLTRLYVTFLSQEPDPALLQTLNTIDHHPEEFVLQGKDVYFFSPHGYGKAKMNNNFFENKLKVAATTRNWKTVNKLVELAGG